MKAKHILALLLVPVLAGCNDNGEPAADVFPPKLSTSPSDAATLKWNEAVVCGSVIFDGAGSVVECGAVYSEEANFDPYDAFSEAPSGKVLKAVGSYDEIEGTISASITGLSGDTEYLYRIFMRNSEKIGFGDQQSFKTPVETHAPEISTLDVTESTLTHFSADLNGAVSNLWNLPLTDCGFVYGTSADFDPSIAPDRISLPAIPSVIGPFTVKCTEFSPDTQYYVCAYGTNSLGTTYGEMVGFRTKSEPGEPGMALVVPVYGSADVTNNMAKLSGRVISSRAGTISEYGIVYSTDDQADLAQWQKKQFIGSLEVNEPFDVELSSLAANTTYYVRSYAVNSDGAGYSDIMSFRTAIEDRYDSSIYYFELPAFERGGVTYIWLDRNLGASRQAESPVDSRAHGWYFQWGRMSDGNQVPGSPTVAVATDAEGKVNNSPDEIVGKFVTTTLSAYDWRPGAYHKAGKTAMPMGDQDKLWSDEAGGGANNPCPPGYRVPTKTEWSALLNQAKGNDAAITVDNVFAMFKITLAGRRAGNGNMGDVGAKAYYWSCTFNTGGTGNQYRPYATQYTTNWTGSAVSSSVGHGNTVRCIKE